MSESGVAPHFNHAHWKKNMRYIAIVLIITLMSACASQNSAREISIRYGTVSDVKRVPVPSAAPAGAIVGGFTGLMLSRNASSSSRVASTVGGAALGGLVTHALEGDRRAYQYTVRFKDGDIAQFVTENGFLYPNDCVAIERSRYNNLRRVSNALCEGIKPLAPQPKQVSEASQCLEAKEQLLSATGDADIDQASRKVRILCQF